MANEILLNKTFVNINQDFDLSKTFELLTDETYFSTQNGTIRLNIDGSALIGESKDFYLYLPQLLLINGYESFKLIVTLTNPKNIEFQGRFFILASGNYYVIKGLTNADTLENNDAAVLDKPNAIATFIYGSSSLLVNKEPFIQQNIWEVSRNN